MENPKVSVVIPIYNVERYLRQCLDSVVNQTLKDIEIICVDDGSPDNCGSIIDEYAQKDNRIVAIHKENGGYGSAINYGFSIAKGEYVGIVESDDWIAPNMYELLYNKAIQSGSDVVKGAFWNVEDSANDQKYISQFVIDIYKHHETFNLKSDPEIIAHFASIWSAIYKKDWLKKNNIKMVEDIRPYEDLPFLAESYSRANSITLVPIPIYFYRKDAANSSNNAVKRTILNYLIQRARSREIYIKNNMFHGELVESFWSLAYFGSQCFYLKPNNKFRKEFFYGMKNLFKHYSEDNCKLKYLKKQNKKDFINIINMSYELYSLNKTLKKMFRFIFSIINTDKHKVLTLLGIKIKFSKKLPRYIIFLAKLLDHIIYKNPKKIVFCSSPDYSDNSKEYYEYLLNNHPNEYELVWLLKGSEGQNIPTKHYKLESIKGLWELLTAKYTVSTFFGLERFVTSKKRINIQLWHGMPLKTIGYLEKNIPLHMFEAYTKDKNNYFFVTSDIFKLSMVTCFLMNPNNVFITGQPRTDCVLSKRNAVKFRDLLNLSLFNKVILYAPTYKECKRKDGGRDVDHVFDNIFYMSDFSEEKFYKMLKDNNILFILKPHPFEENFYRNLERMGMFDHPNIKIVYNSDMRDNGLYFYEIFQCADLMITDFSSIALDFLITNKPVIFLNSLVEEYNKNRGLILEDNYELLMPGEKVNNFEQLCSAIEDAILNDSWKEERIAKLPLIHKYRDNKSSQRVYEIMKGL